MTASSLRTDRSSSGSNTQSASRGWMDVMVEFARSSFSDEEEMTRSERYRRLRADAQRHRAELEAWLAREGLAGEVKAIGEATAFDLLFVKVTPNVADALQHAPDVVAVRPADELSH